MAIKIKSFDDYLEELYIKSLEDGGVPITKDNCEDMFDNWLSNLDVQELLDLGMLYGKEQFMAGEVRAHDLAMKVLTKEVLTK